MVVLFSSKKNCGRAETSSCQDLVFKDTISAIRCGETLKVSPKTTRSAVFIGWSNLDVQSQISTECLCLVWMTILD